MKNYKIELTKGFYKDLENLDNSVRILIFKYLKKLEKSLDPKTYGKRLTGNLYGLYRYRVSNYRIIVKYEEEKLIIYGIAAGHRSTIYKRKF